MPNITLIIPTYNYGQYFDDCLNGILKQTVKPSCVIIVDDGSTDDTHDVVLKTIEEKGQKATNGSLSINGIQFGIIRASQNMGPSAARNVAIKHTIEHTDIYAFNDMDDFYAPKKIEKSMEIFKKCPHVSLVYSDYYIKNDQNNQNNTVSHEFKESYSFKRLSEECIVATNSLISAAAFKKVGLFDESLRVAEDYDLYLRLSEISMLYHIPEPLFTYRITGKGATFSVKKDIWNQCWQKVQQKTIGRRRGPQG